MRLHHLTITAFGPFAGTEEVDFDALSGAGLFLINGPTGAGKTSVLDAVCFALYGRVPSVRNDAKDLRSQHAPPDRGPEVVLDVTIRGRRFRVSRSPKWERPKLRGQGTTEEKAKVLLQERRDGEWVTWSTRFEEAGQKIGDLLGMSAEQFCQVVLLPQGDFAAFLRAGAEDRRAVLEKLFATEVFAQVERWLVERRKEAWREADALRVDAESVADRAAEAAGADRPPELEPAALTAWATELSGHFTDIHAVTAGQVAGAAAVRDAARAAVEDARAVAVRRERHADARRRSAALAERAAERSSLAAALRDADRAGRVLPLLRSAVARATRRDEAGTTVAGRRAALAALVPDDADADLMRKEERSRRDELVELTQRRKDAARLTAIGEELKAVGRAQLDLDAAQAELALFLTDSPRHRQVLTAELEQARARAAATPMASAAVATAEERMEAATRRDALAAGHAGAETEHHVATDAAQAAREAYQEIRQARLDGMAASLAKELVAGEPCQVCGSRDHPAPAVAFGDVPGEEAEAAAEVAWELAQERRDRTGSRLGELAADLAAASSQAGDATAGELAAELADARAELSLLTGAGADAERLEEDLLRVDGEFEEARDRHDEIVAGLADGRAQHTALTGEAARLRAAVDEARGDDPTLEARFRRLDDEAGLLRDTAAAIDALRAADEDARRAEADAGTALAAEGFESAGAARAAETGDDARADMRRRARAYDDEEAKVAELLGDPELASAAASPPPDLAGLEAALARAEEHHQAVGSARDRSRHRSDRLGVLAAELRTCAARWLPAYERHDLAARVVALTSGDPAANRLRMKLSAYVLAARLEQVVAAANERLARMSGTRYSLEHTVDKAAGERGRHGTGGLGLRVIDGWTGRDREPGTLSGGETFITSLALALGLADVVTTEAGGAEIGTLFVDEGFGTLDEDTLDEVMGVLDGLRDGGRAVGIVSHVAELRTRIPVRLRVAKARAGSTLAVTGVPADARG